MRRASIRQDGKIVILAIDGTEHQLPYQVALSLSRALRERGKQAEEYANAESGQLITDQAIIARTGYPIGLTNHPKIQAEAMKEAAWNSNLRRYLPGGIKSQEVVGTPTILPSPPTPEQRTANAAYWAKQKG